MLHRNKVGTIKSKLSNQKELLKFIRKLVHRYALPARFAPADNNK